METKSMDTQYFEAGDVILQSGLTHRGTRLAYQTYGTLNADKSNVIVCMTPFGAMHGDIEWQFKAGKGLDPDKYFIVVPNMLGNGLSSSPSNTPPPYDRARFPNITLYDNVTLQHRLVTEKFGIKKIKLVVGWSMGAQQTNQWGCLYPDMVERIAPFCGSAKTAPHNFVFLEGVKAALTNDVAWNNGWYESPPTKGLRGVGRVYAGWGLSQPFYMQELWRSMGYSSLEDFLVAFWEGFFLPKDANNLLAMLWSWQYGDISANPVFNGDFKKALGAIKAKALVMPGEMDLYFPVVDNEWEVKHMPNAVCRPIPGVWGHFAGGGANPPDTKFIDDNLKELLAS
jgi:homoserine O-acetyltransferase/O-succinyltransferase